MNENVEQVLKNYKRFLSSNLDSEMSNELFYDKLKALLDHYVIKPQIPEVREPCIKCGCELSGRDIIAWCGGLYCSYTCVILKADIKSSEDIKRVILECEEIFGPDIDVK